VSKSSSYVSYKINYYADKTPIVPINKTESQRRFDTIVLDHTTRINSLCCQLLYKNSGSDTYLSGLPTSREYVSCCIPHLLFFLRLKSLKQKDVVQINPHLNSTTFWDISPCSPLSVNRRLVETYRLHLQGRKNKLSKKPE
jgi:hypothetical protein